MNVRGESIILCILGLLKNYELFVTYVEFKDYIY